MNNRYSDSDENQDSKPLRTFLVGDSAQSLDSLHQVFRKNQKFMVVGSAGTHASTIDKIRLTQPDLVCVCHPLNWMDTADFIKMVRPGCCCPIVVVGEQSHGSRLVEMFSLIAVGAKDMLIIPPKESGLKDSDNAVFFDKLRNICRAYAATPWPEQGTLTSVRSGKIPTQGLSLEQRLIVIGASTGGPQIIEQILRGLPATGMPPIVCVQHIADGFLEGMLSWLRQTCKLKVDVAGYGVNPVPGNVYFAPTGNTLTVNEQGRLVFSTCIQPSTTYCPNIDELFLSVAKQYGGGALGILLSGMGKDGAAGLAALKQRGAKTVVQSPATCVVSSMPDTAIQAKAVSQVLNPDKIAACIMQWVS